MRNHFKSLLKRFEAFGDKSAFLLTAPLVAVLYLIDPAMAKTLLEWLIFAPVLAGVSLLVTRIAFPHINFMLLINQTITGNQAAARVASSLILLVGIIMVALVLWAKA